jgi:hypothetical protein
MSVSQVFPMKWKEQIDINSDRRKNVPRSLMLRGIVIGVTVNTTVCSGYSLELTAAEQNLPVSRLSDSIKKRTRDKKRRKLLHFSGVFEGIATIGREPYSTGLRHAVL